MGKAFSRNILRNYVRVNQPKLIRDVAMKQKVLEMLDSVARGIERLEAVLKRIDPNTVQTSEAKLQAPPLARSRTSRHCKTLCSDSRNSPHQTHRTQLKQPRPKVLHGRNFCHSALDSTELLQVLKPATGSFRQYFSVLLLIRHSMREPF